MCKGTFCREMRTFETEMQRFAERGRRVPIRNL